MLDITSGSTVSRIIGDIQSGEMHDRRKAEWKSHMVYSGAQKKYVEDRVKDLWTGSWSSMHISDFSVSKKVVDKIARAYKDGVIRTVESPSDSADLSKMYSEWKVDFSMSEFDQIFNLHRMGCMWVRMLPSGELDFLPLRPYEYFPVLNQDTGELEAMVLNYPDVNTTGVVNYSDGIDQLIADSPADSSATTRVYAIWTKEHHVVVRAQVVNLQNGQTKTQVDFVPIEGNEGNINPLGMIPFVYKARTSTPALPIINPITDQSVELNAMFSAVLSAASLQGFGQLVIKHPAGMQMGAVTSGLTTVMTLPQPDEENQDVDANYINANPDLSGQLETYNSYLRKVLDEHGITANETDGSSKSFNSGLERLIASADVFAKVQENQQIYSECEDDLFMLVKAYMEMTGTNQFGDQELSVKYKKPKVLISDKEILENIQKQLDMGLIEEWEKFILIDPNLTEEQAKDKLEKINQEKEDKIGKFFGETQKEQAQGDNFGPIGQDSQEEGNAVPSIG